MGAGSSLASSGRSLAERPVLRWLTFVIVPGGVYGGMGLWIGDSGVLGAFVDGLAFGVVFATVRVLFEWRSSRF